MKSTELLNAAAHRLSDQSGTLDALIDLAADASFVLLGEASHGTHEFYASRAEITKRLIVERGFQAVAVEAGLARCLSREPLRCRSE